MNSACEVEASALLRFCIAAAEVRSAGSCCRAAWRTNVVELLARDMMAEVEVRQRGFNGCWRREYEVAW